MTIIFSPEAEAEIEAASAVYKVKSPELKDRFLTDIDEALARIEAFPRA